MYIASKYITAAVNHLRSADPSSPLQFQPRDEHDDYAVLDEHGTNTQRHQNRLFANELRKQYGALLMDAKASGRLLYSVDSDRAVEDEQAGAVDDEQIDFHEHFASSSSDPDKGGVIVRAGTAVSAIRRRRFIDRPLAELVWIDLTDGLGTVEVEQEEEVEASYDDLCDQFIEFREDNANNSCAAALRYSLPAKLQSDVLREQIAAFREYRRQRFSLFRKGTLVEESTISSNISALLRFLGYLHYEHASELESTRWI